MGASVCAADCLQSSRMGEDQFCRPAMALLCIRIPDPVYPDPEGLSLCGSLRINVLAVIKSYFYVKKKSIEILIFVY